MTRSSRQRVVLLTGASSGIGHAAAETLVRRGARVFGTSRTDPAHLPASARPHGVEMVQLDVRDPSSVKSAVEKVLHETGRIDCLVNNAGHVLSGTTEETHIDDVSSSMDVNVLGAIRMSQAVLPTMRAQGSGSIVNVSSLGALVGLPGYSTYSASKAALERLSEAMGAEVAVFGVRTSIVQFGDVNTGITQLRSREIQSSIDLYADLLLRARKAMKRGETNGISPGEAAKTISEVAMARNPKQLYCAAPKAQLLLKAAERILPRRVLLRAVHRSYQ